jgi:YlmC/YmxH family sporulation protein
MEEKTTICSLRDREVISTKSGRRLGYVCDAEIDLCSGRVCALIIPGDIRCLGFARSPDVCVPWDAIEKIGNDVILVDCSRVILREKKQILPKKR